MKNNTQYVGLDVHSRTISVAIAEPGRQGQVKFYGTIPNTPDAVKRLVKKIGPAKNLDFCYEAGPCGYVLYWLLIGFGAVCSVIAPSLIPEQVGNKVKTDRRDAEKLARLHRSGELTAIWVPDREHEALRDLVRARETAIEDQQRARNRLSKFFLRRGVKKPHGWSTWTQKHLDWLYKQGEALEFAADRETFTDYIHEVVHQAERIERFARAIEKAVASAPEHLRAVIDALAALKGVARLTATTVAVEVGCFSRFDKPQQLMAYCGVVPREHSSGGPGQARRGRITKAGNAHLRRVLVESSWHYATTKPRVGKALKKRQESVPREIVQLSWRAQHRLSGRYRRLTARGKPAGKALTAVARELLGFMWDIAVRTEASHQAQAARAAAA